MVVFCACLPLRKAVLAYAIANIALTIYDIIILSISYSTVWGVLMVLFLIDIIFSAILLIGLHKENTVLVKIFYGSILVAIGVMVCCCIDGVVVNIIVSIVNLVARTYVLYLITHVVNEMDGTTLPV